MTSKLDRLNLILRVLMETGIVAALGYWGYRTGTSTVTKTLLAIGAPVLGFGFWGAIDFHQAGRLAEPLRLSQELVVSGLAALALYAAGQHVLGWALAALSVLYHALVYARGGRLLKTRIHGSNSATGNGNGQRPPPAHHPTPPRQGLPAKLRDR